MRSNLDTVSKITLFVAGLLTTGCARQQKPAHVPPVSQFVVMSVDQPNAEAAFLTCVLTYVRGGLTPEAALTQCNVGKPILTRGNPLDPSGTPTPIGRGPKRVGPVDCHTSGWNPVAETSEDRASAAKDAAADAAGRYADAKAKLDAAEAHLELLRAIRAAEAEVASAKKERDQALRDWARNVWRIFNEEEKRKAEQKDSPSSNKPAPSGGGETTQSGCEALAAFIAECNSSGWRSPSCQRMLGLMNKCGDPRLTDPVPGEEVSCKYPAIRPEDARRAAVIVCQLRKRPAPGEDPCKPLEIEGTLTRYVLNPGGPPCGDPRAMPGDDQCLSTISLVRFGYKTLQEILDEGVRKFGGPTFIVPKPPRPRPGSRTKA
jgi:hypothetical protein